ncbi:MAG: MbnH family di-heme enzyme [Myxococcota bacterium]
MRGLFFFLGMSACAASELDVREVLELPEHFATPDVPLTNPPTPEAIELGRWLFYDERLSGNQTQSCASCHLQEFAFADGLQRPVGSTGQTLPRNSQGLANVAWASSLTWASPFLVDLEQQIHVPLRAENPIELGMNDGNEQEILDRFLDDPDMVERFALAFPDTDGAVTTNAVVLALASFLRSMVSSRSPYDRFLQGDRDALSAAAERGLTLFNTHPRECFHCHNGTQLTTAYRDASSEPGFLVPQFFNTGLYNVDGEGSYPPHDQGLFEATGDPRDRGRFRVPSLRNVAVTAPYMHDGSVETLREVVLHYAAGGRVIEDGPFAGDGRLSPLKSSFMIGFPVDDDEIDDLVAFLESMTDDTFLSDPRFSDPRKATVAP